MAWSKISPSQSSRLHFPWSAKTWAKNFRAPRSKILGWKWTTSWPLASSPLRVSARARLHPGTAGKKWSVSYHPMRNFRLGLNKLSRHGTGATLLSRALIRSASSRMDFIPNTTPSTVWAMNPALELTPTAPPFNGEMTSLTLKQPIKYLQPSCPLQISFRWSVWGWQSRKNEPERVRCRQRRCLCLKWTLLGPTRQPRRWTIRLVIS